MRSSLRVVSRYLIGPTPCLWVFSALRFSAGSFPMAVMIPMPVTTIFPIKLFLVFGNEFGHGPHGKKDLASVLRVLDLDAIILFKQNDEFKCIDRIQSKPVSKERIVGIYIFRL